MSSKKTHPAKKISINTLQLHKNVGEPNEARQDYVITKKLDENLKHDYSEVVQKNSVVHNPKCKVDNCDNNLVELPVEISSNTATWDTFLGEFTTQSLLYSLQDTVTNDASDSLRTVNSDLIGFLGFSVVTMAIASNNNFVAPKSGNYTPEQIDALSPAQIAALGTDLVGLSLVAMASLDAAQVAAINPAVLALFNDSQLSNLTSAQLTSISAEQIDALSPAQIAALGTDLVGLSLVAMASLDAAQVAAINPAVLALFNDSQLSNLTSAQLTSISAEQIDALSPTQIAALGTDLAGMSPIAIASIDGTQAAGITASQIDNFDISTIRNLTSAAVSGLSAVAVESLDFDQLNALNATGKLDDLTQNLSTSQLSSLTANVIDTAEESNLMNSVIQSEFYSGSAELSLNLLSSVISKVIIQASSGGQSIIETEFESLGLDSITLNTGRANALLSAISGIGIVNVDTLSKLNSLIDVSYPNLPNIDIVAVDDNISTLDTASALSLTGTGEVGATVSLDFSSGRVLTNGNTVAIGLDGSWSKVLTIEDITAFGNGAETITAIQIDLAGNSSASIVRNITVSLTASYINLADTFAGIGGFAINGQAAGDFSGISVSSAGDVNGDGFADLFIGAYRSDPAAGANAGRSYVVFGKASTTAVDLSAVTAGTGGFVINGQAAGDFSGASVSSAGDVNGDGFADLIVGARSSDPTAGTDAGRSYVIFGKANTTAVNLSAVAAGTGGFVINGQAAGDTSGFSVSSAGDVNGDGLADLIIGASSSDPVAGVDAGRSYVVFGKATTAAVDLSAVAAGTGGFVINGQAAGELSGVSVSSAGDVNGDGFSDLIVGARSSDPTAGTDAGRSYVIFGKANTTAVNLSAVAAGTGGFVINGQAAGDFSGISVSSAGDVNGDGFADLIVGAWRSDPAAGADAGRSYVVFGKANTTAVELSAVAVGTGGFVINGQAAGDSSGVSVSSAGDVNGDGLTDLIIGAYSSDPVTGANAGCSYVVFGKASTTAVDLSSVATGTGGFVINGQAAGDSSGVSVSSAGDVNGDGFADLIVGASSSDPVGGVDAGRSYVIWGSAPSVLFQNNVDQLGSTGNDTLTGSSLSETFVAGVGNDVMIGGGGADVMYGGNGNDVFVINSSNVAALSSIYGVGDNNYQLARIDGGAGIDTIRLIEGATLNLSLISKAMTNSNRIESIEKIDLAADSASNTLNLSLEDVLMICGMNNFNNATGWVDGTYDLGSTLEPRHQLMINGTISDIITLDSGWSSVGTVMESGHAYTVYNQGSFAQLFIDSSTVVLP